MNGQEPINPFVVYRDRLDSYARARALGWSEDVFISLVRRADAEVADVAGRGFVTTPCREVPEL
ncbi:MAG: hypothetical protein R3246_10595, partial [Acidimicrobiia bacterium]|nr:hypothetical protein [Acidimicrobiia bacterium]